MPEVMSPSTKSTAHKVSGGQITTASAADTVDTGLSTVLSCVATLDSDPADANIQVSAVKPSSGGTITIKTWKSADGADVTPVAATSFSKRVNWIAFGY